MASADPAALPDDPLIFHWRPRHEISLALPVFFVLSVLVHAVTFYLFQVTYPQNVTLDPPSAEVTLLGPGQASAAFLQWMDEEDPALLLRPLVVTPPQDLSVRYHPSFEATQTLPQLVDAADAPVRMPTAFAPNEFAKRDRPTAPSPSFRHSARPAAPMIRFSEAIRTRRPAALPDWNLSPNVQQNVEPATFLVGISENGVIAYLFLESSSGDPRMDQLAAEFLANLSCRSGGSRVNWGFITVE